MNEDNRLDNATYESSRTYLKAALEHMLAAGRSVRELSEFALEKFGNDFLPYLQQFQRDVRQGRVTVDGLSRSARDAVLGHHVTDEQRDEMIRQVAYLRAEQRGFAGGSPEQDWIDAEREVDAQLARRAGLVVKGSKALASVTAVVEKELAGSQRVVTRWLASKSPAGPAVKKTAGGKKRAVRAAQTGRTNRSAAGSTGQAPAGAGKKAARMKAPAKGATSSVKKTPAAGKKAAATTKKKAKPASGGGRTGATRKTAASSAGGRTGATRKAAASSAGGRTGATRKAAASSAGGRTGTTGKKTRAASGGKTGTRQRAAAVKKARKPGRRGA